MRAVGPNKCEDCGRICIPNGGRYDDSTMPPAYYCHVCWKSWESTKPSAATPGLQCAQCGRACAANGGQYDASGATAMLYCNLCWKLWTPMQVPYVSLATLGPTFDDTFWQAQVIQADEQNGDSQTKKEVNRWLAILTKNAHSAMIDVLPEPASTATRRKAKHVSHSTAPEIVNIDADGHDGEAGSEDVEAEELDVVADLPTMLPKCRGAGPEASIAHIVFIIDRSGSMRTVDVNDSEGGDPLARITSVLLTLREFLCTQSEQGSANVYSLISFSDDSETHFVTRRGAAALEAVSNLELAASRQTEYICGLEAACKAVDADSKKRRPYFVLLSDGRPGDAVKMLARVQKMLNYRPKLRLHTIGFGGSLTSFAHLQQLASIGNGTFIPAGLSLSSLQNAFSSVSSTITHTQMHSFTFGDRSSEEDGEPGKRKPGKGKLRVVVYESPGPFNFNSSESMALKCSRTRFWFDGKTVNRAVHSFPASVKIRILPFTKGGMRLVHGFEDPQMLVRRLSFSETLEAHARLVDKGACSRMVAKMSKYADDNHNSIEQVSKFAHSHAVARFYARIFNKILHKKRPNSKEAMLVFVEVVLYECLGGAAPAKCMIGELYLPGIFLKYNSNNGFVNPDAPGSHVAQAFSHFTHVSTNGEMMVVDLQGVYSDAESWKTPRLLLTDPQVLSRSRSFGHPGQFEGPL
eukprot:TRINITY_DN13249_c0_g1_i2.p1 TRINITY_DN13249_c0_g1~~TRINITY_DN13249_c0_g1_i2.p1  ORF type:complete len:692 (-),score=90.41 TRINITY_DN13249_c0_g1_i2:1388-3463(-)